MFGAVRDAFVSLSTRSHVTHRIAMKRDLLVICSGGMLAFGVVAWGFWGYSETLSATPRFNQQMQADPDLKFVSEQSPYMRTDC